MTLDCKHHQHGVGACLAHVFLPRTYHSAWHRVSAQKMCVESVNSRAVTEASVMNSVSAHCFSLTGHWRISGGNCRFTPLHPEHCSIPLWNTYPFSKHKMKWTLAKSLFLWVDAAKPSNQHLPFTRTHGQKALLPVFQTDLPMIGTQNKKQGPAGHMGTLSIRQAAHLELRQTLVSVFLGAEYDLRCSPCEVRRGKQHWPFRKYPQFSPRRVFGGIPKSSLCPASACSGASPLPLDPQRLRMSYAAIGCFVLSGELCGCWKAALKARECLIARFPGRRALGITLLQISLGESHWRAGSCKGYAGDLRPAGMNASRLPGVNRLKQFWRVSKRTPNNLLKKSLILGGKKRAKLLWEMCREILALSHKPPLGRLNHDTWWLAEG